MPKTYWNKEKKEKRLSKSENLRFRQWLCESFSRCQICGVNPPQDPHHLFFGAFGANKDDRTQIAVCRECHDYCHKHKKESQERYEHIAQENWTLFKESVI